MVSIDLSAKGAGQGSEVDQTNNELELAMLKSRFSLGVAALVALFFVASVTPVSAGLAEGEVAEMLIGSWKADKEKTKKLLKEQDVDEEEIENLLEEIGGFTLVIDKDKSFALQTADGEELEGTWEIKSEDTDKNEVVMTMKLFDDPMEMTFKVLDMGKHVQVQPDGEKPAVFKKEEKKADK